VCSACRSCMQLFYTTVAPSRYQASESRGSRGSRRILQAARDQALNPVAGPGAASRRRSAPSR
jgi:hypothetical protein